jgi:hypothetical protein
LLSRCVSLSRCLTNATAGVTAAAAGVTAAAAGVTAAAAGVTAAAAGVTTAAAGVTATTAGVTAAAAGVTGGTAAASASVSAAASSTVGGGSASALPSGGVGGPGATAGAASAASPTCKPTFKRPCPLCSPRAFSLRPSLSRRRSSWCSAARAAARASRASRRCCIWPTFEGAAPPAAPPAAAGACAGACASAVLAGGSAVAVVVNAARSPAPGSETRWAAALSSMQAMAAFTDPRLTATFAGSVVVCPLLLRPLVAEGSG